MAWHNNPRIVTNGLILCLDANDIKSYSGSGSTWYDTSGNSNDITLYNSPTFSNGSFLFNGTNQYGGGGDNDDLYPQEVTVEVWTKAVDESNLDHVTNIVGKGDWNTSGGHWQIGYRSGGAVQFNYNDQWGDGITKLLSTYDATEWHCFQGTCNTYEAQFWFNNTYVGARVTQDSERDLNNYSFEIARSSYYANFYNGYVSIVRMYNRVLSRDELTQNYNAHRSRFGL